MAKAEMKTLNQKSIIIKWKFCVTHISLSEKVSPEFPTPNATRWRDLPRAFERSAALHYTDQRLFVCITKSNFDYQPHFNEVSETLSQST